MSEQMTYINEKIDSLFVNPEDKVDIINEINQSVKELFRVG